MKNTKRLSLLLTSLVLSASLRAETGTTEINDVVLTPAQATMINLKVGTLEARIVEQIIVAPGEIEMNAETSWLISPTVASVVVARHVGLGEYVDKSQVVVTLYSDTIVDVQSQYLINLSEWQLVKKLGRDVVGQNRFVTAKSQYESSLSRLMGYGLSEKTIESLQNEGASLGQYTLRAGGAGLVLNDNFQLGQSVSAGEPLIQLFDEKTRWVSVNLPSSFPLLSADEQVVEVIFNNKQYSATVIQQGYSLDETTRTRKVRLLLDNANRQMYPGQFVEVQFSVPTDKPIITVPDSALIRSSDGGWTLFIERSPGKFTPTEVTLGRTFGELQEVFGVESGGRVVMDGAFYLAAELAKSNFADND